MNMKTPWAREICGKRSTRGFIQREHLRSNAREKPFKFRDCGRAFERKNDCKRHEKLHAKGTFVSKFRVFKALFICAIFLEDSGGRKNT
jgi:hypothetical protein